MSEKLLAQLQRSIALRRIENRSIILAYHEAEVGRLDEAVYAPLQKQYPSLKGITDELRKREDPIEKMAKTKSHLRMLESVQGLVSVVSMIDNDDQELENAAALLNKIGPCVDLYQKFAPIQEQFYVDIAHAARDVSLSNEVSIATAVQEPKYMDEVTRIVHPTRDEAEALVRTYQLFGNEVADVVRGFITFAKKTGQADADLLAQEKLLPTPRALDAAKKGVLEYKAAEFDRVYSL